MKFRCPKREIREATWTRLAEPAVMERHAFMEKLRAHDSDGHFWYNHIYTHWWVEKEEDVIWMMSNK